MSLSTNSDPNASSVSLVSSNTSLEGSFSDGQDLDLTNPDDSDGAGGGDGDEESFESGSLASSLSQQDR